MKLQKIEELRKLYIKGREFYTVDNYGTRDNPEPTIAKVKIDLSWFNTETNKYCISIMGDKYIYNCYNIDESGKIIYKTDSGQKLNKIFDKECDAKKELIKFVKQEIKFHQNKIKKLNKILEKK